MTFVRRRTWRGLVANLYDTPPEMVETVKKLVPTLQ
jgi:glucose-6-phosphate dehydrogenase assembly protein OpcA